MAVQSGYIYHHTIICFSEVQISFNTLFSIFVDYNSLFNVFTNGIIRRSNGFSRWWVINKTFAVIKNGNVFN